MEAGVGTTIRVIQPNHPRCGETGRIVVDDRLTGGVLVKFDKDGAPGAFSLVHLEVVPGAASSAAAAPGGGFVVTTQEPVSPPCSPPAARRQDEILAELKAQFEAKHERCSANSPNAGRRLCGCGAHVPHIVTFDHLLATGIWTLRDIAAVSGGKEAIARYMVRLYGKDVFTQKQREEAGVSCKTWHRGWYGYQPKVPDPVAAGGGERPRPTQCGHERHSPSHLHVMNRCSCR